MFVRLVAVHRNSARQDRKLQRQAQEELQREHEQNKTGITKDDMERILAEGDRI